MTDSNNSFYNLNISRQIGLLVGLAISIALGVGVILWAQDPEYRLIFSDLSQGNAMEAISVLDKQGVNYKLSSDSGALMVPSEDVFKVRLLLSQKGIVQSGSRGFELLDKKQPFGTSQFMEMSRYRRALEGELMRTIASMDNVRTARVHLAIPKQSVFVRDQRKPTASVLVDLYAGRSLDQHQVDAIINMVASSVSEMDAKDVTVVDQKGRLLSETSENEDFLQTTRQLRIKREIENDYISRIVAILSPILGDHRIRAQVSSQLDFTTVEKTSETFSPDKSSVRSSHIISEKKSGAGAQEGGGIPGALSNVPSTGVSEREGDAEQAGVVTNEIRNYEVDKTISHTRSQPWKLLRLSAAVAIDFKGVVDENGKLSKQPLKEAELDRITRIVKNAIGYNEARGDEVNVVNFEFASHPDAEPLPEPKFWTQAWFFQLIKYILAGVGIIFLLFGVLRPILRSLATPTLLSAQALLPAAGDEISDDRATLSQDGSMPTLPEPSSTYSVRVENVRNLVRSEPERVAQVVMNWVEQDNEQG